MIELNLREELDLENATIGSIIDVLEKFPKDTKIIIEDPDTQWVIKKAMITEHKGGLLFSASYDNIGPESSYD